MGTNRKIEPVRTVAAIQALSDVWRREQFSVSLVPTMGALHAGHLKLVEEARQHADRVIVSVFVNPAQFAPHEDFASYPRHEAADLSLLEPAGTDAVFAPSTAEMYPEGFATKIQVGGPAEGLESDFRPHFFGGVATVVAKLLGACRPHRALFGEKDYQQLLVVRRLTADLNLGVAIVGVPTVREADGLALSSRNAYLSPAQRKIAPELHRALAKAAGAIRSGAAAETVTAEATESLGKAGFRMDYFALRNAETLSAVKDLRAEPLRLLAAGWLGRTRLIDNLAA